MFTELVNAHIKFQKNKSYGVSRVIETIENDLRRDLIHAFEQSEPLIKQYKNVFDNSNCFFAFLMKLSNISLKLRDDVTPSPTSQQPTPQPQPQQPTAQQFVTPQQPTAQQLVIPQQPTAQQLAIPQPTALQQPLAISQDESKFIEDIKQLCHKHENPKYFQNDLKKYVFFLDTKLDEMNNLSRFLFAHCNPNETLLSCMHRILQEHDSCKKELEKQLKTEQILKQQSQEECAKYNKSIQDEKHKCILEKHQMELEIKTLKHQISSLQVENQQLKDRQHGDNFREKLRDVCMYFNQYIENYHIISDSISQIGEIIRDINMQNVQTKIEELKVQHLSLRVLDQQLTSNPNFELCIPEMPHLNVVQKIHEQTLKLNAKARQEIHLLRKIIYSIFIKLREYFYKVRLDRENVNFLSSIFIDSQRDLLSIPTLEFTEQLALLEPIQQALVSAAATASEQPQEMQVVTQSPEIQQALSEIITTGQQLMTAQQDISVRQQRLATIEQQVINALQHFFTNSQPTEQLTAPQIPSISAPQIPSAPQVPSISAPQIPSISGGVFGQPIVQEIEEKKTEPVETLLALLPSVETELHSIEAASNVEIQLAEMEKKYNDCETNLKKKLEEVVKLKDELKKCHENIFIQPAKPSPDLFSTKGEKEELQKEITSKDEEIETLKKQNAIYANIFQEITSKINEVQKLFSGQNLLTYNVEDIRKALQFIKTEIEKNQKDLDECRKQLETSPKLVEVSKDENIEGINKKLKSDNDVYAAFFKEVMNQDLSNVKDIPAALQSIKTEIENITATNTSQDEKLKKIEVENIGYAIFYNNVSSKINELQKLFGEQELPASKPMEMLNAIQIEIKNLKKQLNSYQTIISNLYDLILSMNIRLPIFLEDDPTLKNELIKDSISKFVNEAKFLLTDIQKWKKLIIDILYNFLLNFNITSVPVTIDNVQDIFNLINNQIKALIQEKDRLIGSVGTLMQEKGTLVQEKETLMQEKETLMQERETLVQEKETLMEEKETLVQEKADIAKKLQVVQRRAAMYKPRNKTESSFFKLMYTNLTSIFSETPIDTKKVTKQEVNDLLLKINNMIKPYVKPSPSKTVVSLESPSSSTTVVTSAIPLIPVVSSKFVSPSTIVVSPKSVSPSTTVVASTFPSTTVVSSTSPSTTVVPPTSTSPSPSTFISPSPSTSTSPSPPKLVALSVSIPETIEVPKILPSKTAPSKVSIEMPKVNPQDEEAMDTKGMAKRLITEKEEEEEEEDSEGKRLKKSNLPKRKIY